MQWNMVCTSTYRQIVLAVFIYVLMLGINIAVYQY